MKSLKKSQFAGMMLLVSLGTIAPALAQTGLPAASAPVSPSAAAPVATTPDYRVAPSDVLSINIADWPNNSAQTTVAPDGTVTMPLVHQVPVAGLTLSQVTDLITAKWKKYIIDPSVTVTLIQRHPQFVVFSGSVARPGPLEYRPGMHIVEALAEIGGFVITGSPSAGASTSVGLQTTIADPSHVSVTREDGTKQVLNLTHQETLADTPADIALEPGDVIYVPQQLGKIDVIGQVHQPGVIPYRDNLTVFDAISDTGGFNDGTADLSNATLVHDGRPSPINLDPMLRHGDMAANITLAPGDQISIPEIKNKTFVYGDVARPGAYFYKPGDHIQDALSGVSGPTGAADLGKINVIHKDPIHGTQIVRVDFNKFVLHGDPSGNPMIQSGDTLYIPDKRRPISLQDFFGGLGNVGGAAYGINAFK